MAENEYTSKFKIDISDLKKGMQEANQIMRVANSEFKAATGGMKSWGSSADGLSAKLKQLTAVHNAQADKLELLEAEYKRVAAAEGENSKGAQELYIKINNLKGEIGKTEAQIKTYSDKLNDVKNAEKEAVQAAQEQTSGYDKLKQSISEQESKLSGLKQEYAQVALEQGESSNEAKRLGQEINRVSSELVENKSKLSDAESAADKFDKTLEDTGDSAEKAKSGFTVMKGALAELVADGIRKAVDAFKDLMTASSEASAIFQAQTGASAAEMEKFKSSIESVYAQNFGESMNDVAEAMAEVKRQTGEIDPSKLEEMTKNGITLCDTFGYDVTESVRSVNMLMKQFGMNSEEAFDLVATGAQNGLDKNGDLLDTINEYAPYYAAQGYSAEEFYNSLKNGVDAGTFSVDKLGDAMKEFGIRSKDTADSTTEGFQLIGLNADEMRAKFAQGGDTAREATQQTMQALMGLDDQVTQNQAGVDLFGTMWEDLGIEGVKALMDVSGEAGNTAGAMKQIQDVKYGDVSNQIAGIGRTLKGELLQPLVDEVTPALSDFLQQVQDKIPGVFDKLREGLDILKEWKPAIVGLGGAIATYFVAAKIQEFVAALRSGEMATKAMEKAQAALNIVMNLNPIALVVAAIAGLVIAFVLLWNKSEAFRNFWIGLWDGIKSTTGTVVDGIVNFFTVTIPEAFENAKTSVSDFVNNAVTFFTELPDKIRIAIAGALDAIAEWGSNLIAKGAEVGTNFVQAVISFFDNLPYKIGFALGTIIGTVAAWVVNMGTKAQELGTNFINAVVTFFAELPGKITTFITNAYMAVTSWAINMVQKARETGTNFLNNLVTFFQQLPGRIKTFIQSALAAVIQWASQMAEKARDAGSKFLSNVISFIQQLPSKVKSFLSQVISALASWVSQMGQKGADAAKQLGNNLVNGLKSIPSKMLSIGKNIVEGIWKGISGAAGWLKDKIAGFASGLVDGVMSSLGIHSPSKVFADKVGKWIPAGIAQGVEENAKSAVKSVKKLAGNLTPAVDGITGQVQGVISGIGTRGNAGTSNGITQNFYQYNNSPKALTRLEIYRQTRNQLRAAKGAV